MKKTLCILLCCFLVVLTLGGCNKQQNVQSDYSDYTVIEEIVIEDENTSEDETSEVLQSSLDVESSSNIESTQSQVSSSTSSEDESTSSNGDTVESSKVDSSTCSHNYSDIEIQKEARLFEAGVKKYTCAQCGDNYTATYPVEKIKLLSIGNSYSQNALWSFYEVCKDAGVKEIDIAVMYVAGCSLDMHWENVQSNASTYEVFRNNSGSWESTLNCSIESLLNEGGWDIITLQNKSDQSADKTKFSNLDNMVNYVSEKCPDSEILWHMTWAYTSNSKYLDAKYEKNDRLMFEDITDCVQNIVAKNEKIHSIVPVGTAIMNARTSRVKDNVHLDDGSHLNGEIGYYVAAFTWFGHITGMQLYDANFAPLNSNTIQNLDVLRESAENALKNPYKITQSYYTN